MLKTKHLKEATLDGWRTYTALYSRGTYYVLVMDFDSKFFPFGHTVFANVDKLALKTEIYTKTGQIFDF